MRVPSSLKSTGYATQKTLAAGGSSTAIGRAFLEESKVNVFFFN